MVNLNSCCGTLVRQEGGICNNINIYMALLMHKSLAVRLG